MSPRVPMMEPKCGNLLDCTLCTCSLTVLTKRISVCTEMMALPHCPLQESRLVKPEEKKRVFKSCGFGITIEIMPLQTDFLDVTFDLPSGKYWPYRKPTIEPLYVNAKSNHPPVVIKHLPMNITERLSSISCNKDELNKSKPIYGEALKKSGFDGYMSFIDPATRKNKRKRIRKTFIWFNPPFDKNVTTNVAKRFL